MIWNNKVDRDIMMYHTQVTKIFKTNRNVSPTLHVNGTLPLHTLKNITDGGVAFNLRNKYIVSGTRNGWYYNVTSCDISVHVDDLTPIQKDGFSTFYANSCNLCSVSIL